MGEGGRSLHSIRHYEESLHADKWETIPNMAAEDDAG